MQHFDPDAAAHTFLPCCARSSAEIVRSLRRHRPSFEPFETVPMWERCQSVNELGPRRRSPAPPVTGSFVVTPTTEAETSTTSFARSVWLIAQEPETLGLRWDVGLWSERANLHVRRILATASPPRSGPFEGPDGASC